MNSVIESLAEVPSLLEEFLRRQKESGEVEELAEKFYKTKNALYLGRHINYPIALEGALKLKEISYIHAEGYPAGEMKHGPIALIDEDMLVVFVCGKGETYKKILSNMEEVKARHGKIIAVATKNMKETKELADYTITVPETELMLSPIVNVVPLQLFAYHIASFLGYDVDQPRNLAKSVTVE
jgi:glucosamine--fructose-6-phosphate aminotransferase (isomerizing)